MSMEFKLQLNESKSRKWSKYQIGSYHKYKVFLNLFNGHLQLAGYKIVKIIIYKCKYQTQSFISVYESLLVFFEHISFDTNLYQMHRIENVPTVCGFIGGKSAMFNYF